MEIVNINTKDLIPYANNTRTHDEKQIKQIAASIQEFGFTNPVLIGESNDVIAGHGRILAAEKLKMQTVPCIILNGLTQAQKKAYIIADNKLALNAGWDEDLLRLEIENLKELNFDIDLIGFNAEEIDAILGAGQPEEVVEDDFEMVLPEEPKSQRGDIWVLGRHRLMCGDSTSEDVDALMESEKADMVFTDPPYGISYSGGRTGGRNKPAHGQIKNDELQGFELGELIKRVFTNNKEDADVYICVSPIMQKPFLDALEEKEKEIDAVIVWDKKNPGLGYMAYRRQCEFVYFIKGGAFHKGDKSDFDLWSISKESTKGYVHGTQKPVAVPGRAIENSSKKDNSVLDLFGGSGSTLIAAEQLSRICYMMELDEKYIDVIVHRYKEFKKSTDGIKLLRCGKEHSYEEIFEVK